jgi:phosphoenolpyruvate carboxylase
MNIQPKQKRFEQNILNKYQVYNSIFMTLPFDTVHDTGVLLPLFDKLCARGYQEGKDPVEIVDQFTDKYLDSPTEKEKIDLFFQFIQYIERQVVLFDAIEDAAFPVVNNMNGIGTLRNTKEEAFARNKKETLKKYLEEFKVRLVLTAHPTQFYPDSVLGIITDLISAIEKNNLILIKKLLAQLGKTPFLKEVKPTPYDEAVSLIWYLENVFYQAISRIYNYIRSNIYQNEIIENEIVSLGFWSGGDRDGNPFVTTEITLNVAKRLRNTVIKNYYMDVRALKRRLTFKNVAPVIAEIEEKLYKTFTSNNEKTAISKKELLSKLLKIRDILITHHQSLFLQELDDLINKIHLFGYHFATLDIRQDSRIHRKVFLQLIKELKENNINILPDDYLQLSEEEQIQLLSEVRGHLNYNDFKEEQLVKTLGAIYALKKIQKLNGEKGANRYIISNNQNAVNVMEVFAMLNLSGYPKRLPVDVVPLFETVNDLKNAHHTMQKLYTNEKYRDHLKNRKNRQTIMLGFSDGTKDGGYLMANWSIYKAKERLTEVSRKNGITAIFFDGRGGPPARGGGKTHQFYASLGPKIESKEIQLTIQGQTISSKFGTVDSARYNMEQLISSGVSNQIFDGVKNKMSKKNKQLMDDLAEMSYQAYSDFKSHPKFLDYLEKISTLKYYAKTNIGSRPSKRGQSDKLDFSDLRAIPFVGSWSQLKQNVPGFFGVGTALKKYEDQGDFQLLINFYKNSKFFKSLIDNSMMAMKKSFFELTAYMKDDPEFGDFWKLIYQEFLLTRRLTLKLSGQEFLLQDDPLSRSSIEVREAIVLPLLTIQQYALKRLQELKNEKDPDQKEIDIYEKIVTRSLFGNINASRNSA